MPPKVKKGGKKNKKTKIPIDDVDTTILNREKLEEFCVNVNNEFTKEKENSEFLRLDRDKLVNMIAISREQLKILRFKTRQAEIEIRDAEDEHRVQMGSIRQRVLHSKNELESQCLDQKRGTSQTISDEREGHEKVAIEIISDINLLKRQIVQREHIFFTTKVKIGNEQAEEIHRVQDKWKNIQLLSETKLDKIVKEQTSQLEDIFEAGYKKLVHLKDNEYRMFLDDNTKRTTQLHYYYNRIVDHNNEIIQALKNNMLDARESMGKLDKQYLQLKEENRILTEELCRLNKEKKIIQKKLSASIHQKHELKKTKVKLQKNKRLLLDLSVEYDVLDMIKEKQDIICGENEFLETTTLFKSCSKAQLILLALELFLIHIYNGLNEINSSLSKVKDIYEKKGKWNKLLESVSEYQDNSLNSVTYGITEIVEKRNDLFRTYRKMLKKFNIPFGNTGFIPLRFEEIMSKIDNPRMLVNYNNSNPLLINSMVKFFHH